LLGAQGRIRCGQIEQNNMGLASAGMAPA